MTKQKMEKVKYLYRSRRDQFKVSGMRLERQPSLERREASLERRQSLERAERHTSERRPSLEQINYKSSERRQSLERANDCTSERRPSLERINYQRSERRQSLERANGRTSERRPSLERINNQRSERRQSLERAIGHTSERRASLERVQLNLNRSNKERNTGSSGISTLHPWSLDKRDVPSNWDLSAVPEQRNKDFCLVQLSPGDSEYSVIIVDFEEAGLTVKCIERLQNHVLLDRFKSEKQLLLKRLSETELNECYLYHGTQARKSHLCEEGLDARLSFQGCFGRGIYFSDNPRKCIQYANASTDKSKEAMILVCRVMLGESKIYPDGMMDPDLKREPVKPTHKSGWRYYDSVQGIPKDYPEFVVYDNRRAMIEYVVTFEEAAFQSQPSDQLRCQEPSGGLYKDHLEQVELPLPEDELDKLYLLTPDSDSDGSCDEHTREVERLRENVRRNKAKQLGIPYQPPSEEQKKYDRRHWKKVCYFSCPPNSPLFEMMIKKKRDERAERKQRKQLARKKPKEIEASCSADTIYGATASEENANDRKMQSSLWTSGYVDEERVENDSVAEVLDNLIAEFVTITASDDVPKARRCIMENGMDLEKAIVQFYNEA